MDLKEYFKDRLYGQLQESIWNYGQKAIDTLRQRDVAARGYSDFVPKSVIQHGGSQVSPPRQRTQMTDDLLNRKTAPTKLDIARGAKPKFMPKEIPYDGRGRIPMQFDGNETSKSPLQRFRVREILRKEPNKGSSLNPVYR